MTKAILSLAGVMVICVALGAQKPDADIQKLADQYQAAFNKGDAKAVTALYTADALRVTPSGKLVSGKPAIEKDYAENFAGPFKGAKLTLHPGRTQNLKADVALIEGTFEVAGAAALKGRYLNTIVREGGQWKLASVVTVPSTAAPAK
jgi:uncharacterized protein (TIGR02246 family)